MSNLYRRTSIGKAALVALMALVAILSYACGGGGDNATSSATATGSGSTVTATGTTAAATTTAKATATPAEATPMPPPCSTVAGPVVMATPRHVAFTFQDGACVAGSGLARIGPFTVTSAWRITWQFDPQCSEVQLLSSAVATDTAGGTAFIKAFDPKGGGTWDFPERADPATPAQWTLDFGAPCPWTVTFSSIP